MYVCGVLSRSDSSSLDLGRGSLTISELGSGWLTALYPGEVGLRRLLVVVVSVIEKKLTALYPGEVGLRRPL